MTRKPLADRIYTSSTANGSNTDSIANRILADICGILAEPCGSSSSGHAYLSDHAFQSFLNRVPHLFSHGLRTIDALESICLEASQRTEFDDQEKHQIKRSSGILKNVVLTAAVTAPPDLWILRHLLAALQICKVLPDGFGRISLDGIMAQAPKISLVYLRASLDFLVARRVLAMTTDGQGTNIAWEPASAAAQEILNSPWHANHFPENLVEGIRAALLGDLNAQMQLDHFFALPITESRPHLHWTPTSTEIEIGFRLLPFALAARQIVVDSSFEENEPIEKYFKHLSAQMLSMLRAAGVVTSDHKLSIIGERIFKRGIGPFGIIHAYHPYMKLLSDLISGNPKGAWVERGANVAASREANAKSFALANDAIDRFCQDHNFEFTLFIEHAVGQGEATRQRSLRDKHGVAYVGADLEAAAINSAKSLQAAGVLPASMRFVDAADIGEPSTLLSALATLGLDPTGSIMVVGNGFHEVRNQTNEKMVDVFRQYSAAGIILVFTEESGLTNQDLIATGWNTYHAGFRFVHEISGQGLRPAIDGEPSPWSAAKIARQSALARQSADNPQPDITERWSWKKCAEQGGYRVLEKYSVRSRTIYPHPRPDGNNPSISVTYFCVPKELSVLRND